MCGDVCEGPYIELQKASGVDRYTVRYKGELP